MHVYYAVEGQEYVYGVVCSWVAERSYRKSEADRICEDLNKRDRNDNKTYTVREVRIERQ